MIIRLSTHLIALLGICACGISPQIAEKEALLQDPEWPQVRQAAVTEVIRREGAINWRAITHHPDAVWPISKKDGAWHVGAAQDYPGNTLGGVVFLKLDKDRHILRYQRKWENNQEEPNKSSLLTGHQPILHTPSALQSRP